MRKYKINLGNYRTAIFQIDEEDNIIQATFKQGVSEMEVSKFSDLFDINYILKHGVEQIY